jgi:hypothetical protein
VQLLIPSALIDDTSEREPGASRDQSGASRHHETGAAGDLSQLTAEIVGAGPVPGPIWERIACDSVVRRIVVDAAGLPIDAGRAVRTASAVQRAALLVRDRGCAYPGCGRPGGWTDAHHIRHWRHGGRTDLDNLILLCRHHHSDLHRGEYTIAVVDRRARFSHRTGRVIGQHRMGNLRT